MEALVSLPADGGLTAACDALGVARATVYRHRARRAGPMAPSPSRSRPPRTLTQPDRSRRGSSGRSRALPRFTPGADVTTLCPHG